MNNSLHDVDLFSEEISSEDLHAEVLPETAAASTLGSAFTFGCASGGSKGTASSIGTNSG